MIASLESASRRLYVLLLCGFVFSGAIFTSVGAALPHIIRTFGWSYAISGLVLAANAIGYSLSTFVNGFLVQRIPPKAVMVVGCALGAASLSLFMRWPSPWLNLGLNFGVGLCQGCLEVVTNLEIIHMERQGQSRLMNFAHAVFGIGALAGPSAAGAILGSGTPLAAFFLGSTAVCILLLIFAARIRFPRVQPSAAAVAAGGARLLRHPLVLVMTAAFLVYVGTEIGVSSWSSEYVVRTLALPASTAALAVAVFWTGMVGGRLTISFAFHRSRQELLMLGLTALSAAALVTVLLAHSILAVAVAIFVAGLGCSGFYPLGMSVLGRHLKSGVAVGTAATGGAVGSVVFPFLMALLSQAAGIRTGFWFYLGLMLLLLALSFLLVRVVRATGDSTGASF
jgi:FHS family glucose/mannose:H+ symporter-like MFS transporter